VCLDPLRSASEQLHSFALLRFLPLYNFLDFPLFPVFLKALLPLSLELVKFVELIFELFI
jgi:hypothetical protein